MTAPARWRRQKLTILYADALIEIAAAYVFFRIDPTYTGRNSCLHCGCSMDVGCDDGCPGLLARRALGLA